MKRLLVVVLLVPLASGGLAWQQSAATDLAGQPTFAPFSEGDRGSATIGASQASAAVTVSALAILIEDDVLVATPTDDAWQVHAEYIEHTGFAGSLITLDIKLRHNGATETALRIKGGVATLAEGMSMDVSAAAPVEVRAVCSAGASGTVELDVVFTRGNVQVRQNVVLTVR